MSINGRRLTGYGKTQGEVRDWLKQTLTQVDQDVAVTAPQTVGEFLTEWLEAVKPSIRPKSYETYAWNIRHHIIPSLGNIKLRELRPDHIQRFYTNKLGDGTGTATVRMSHGVLRRALGHALKWRLLAYNVSDVVVPPRPKTQEMSVLMLQLGVHPKVVQERLGHSSISMTLNTYSHVLPSLQEDVADRLDEVL